MKKIVVVNAGPRKNWNTDKLLQAAYAMTGYDKLLEGYQATLSNFVGPTTVLTCGDTLQVNDYSRYDWTMFDPAAKQKHHDETFAEYEAKAYALGQVILSRPVPRSSSR